LTWSNKAAINALEPKKIPRNSIY